MAGWSLWSVTVEGGVDGECEKLGGKRRWRETEWVGEGCGMLGGRKRGVAVEWSPLGSYCVVAGACC